MTEQPWEHYLAIFGARAARVPPDAFGRGELLYEAAHDAYQATTNHMTQTGWDEEHALTVTRMFGQAVKEWLAREETSLDDLRDDLRRQYDEWTARS